MKDVKGIAEEIEVQLPFSVKHDDEDIATAAVNRMNWDTSVPKDSVKAKVENGWITLTGEVDWHYQQEAAAHDVRGLWGVVGVLNQISIRSKPNAAKIKEDIIIALDRSWLDPATINVTAQDGKVKLTGTVESWHERDEANSTAWAAPGTTSVENEIAVL